MQSVELVFPFFFFLHNLRFLWGYFNSYLQRKLLKQFSVFVKTTLRETVKFNATSGVIYSFRKA